MYRLRQPEALRSDECLASLVMRNAATYRFAQPERLFRRLKVGRTTLAMLCGEDPSAERGVSMAHLLGLTPDEFARVSLWHPSRTMVNLLGHEVHHEMVRHRRRAFCPLCLQDNGHHRAIWLVDLLPVCAVHGTLLQDRCPRCFPRRGRPLAWQGVGPNRCRCRFDLREASPIPFEGAGLPGIIALDAVFHGHAAAPLGLTFGQLLGASFWLGLYALGREKEVNHSQRTAGFIRKHATDLPEILGTGWAALQDWPDGFNACLARIRSVGSPDGAGGLEKSFRGLHAWMLRWSRAGWGRPLAEEFARHAASAPEVAATRHALLAYGSRKVVRRADMTMREAQEFLGVSAATMQRIVDRNPGMVIRASAPGVPSLLKGDDVRRLKRADAGLLTIKGVQSVLGIGRPAFLNLEAMGLVARVPETEYILATRGYRRKDVEALRDRCLGGAATVSPEEEKSLGLCTIEEGSRAWRTTYDIIGALAERRIKAAALRSGKRGLRAVLLRASELDTVLPHREALRTSSVVSAELGLKPAVLRTWRRAGYIRAEEDYLPGRRAGVFYSATEIRAFQAAYISSADLARADGKGTLAGAGVARDLIEIGVQALSGPGIDDSGTYLFRRADLTEKLLARARARRSKPDLAVQREVGRSRVDLALAAVMASWGEADRRRNTLTFRETGRLVHAVAGTRVSLVGRFTFHVHPEVHGRLSAAQDAWLALVPSEGDRFLLVPFSRIEWPRHVGDGANKVKWLSMRLQPVVEKRWVEYLLPLSLN